MIEIDLGAIRSNLDWSPAPGAGRGPHGVVKADAYGHGAVAVARKRPKPRQTLGHGRGRRAKACRTRRRDSRAAPTSRRTRARSLLRLTTTIDALAQRAPSARRVPPSSQSTWTPISA